MAREAVIKKSWLSVITFKLNAVMLSSMFFIFAAQAVMSAMYIQNRDFPVHYWQEPNIFSSGLTPLSLLVF